MAEENKLELHEGEHIKIEIVQQTNGNLGINVIGQKEVPFYNVIGLLEAAKHDLLSRVGKDEEVVEIEIDELDLKLNPDTQLKVGDKVPIPVGAFEAREKQRQEALKGEEKKAPMKAVKK